LNADHLNRGGAKEEGDTKKKSWRNTLVRRNTRGRSQKLSKGGEKLQGGLLTLTTGRRGGRREKPAGSSSWRERAERGGQRKDCGDTSGGPSHTKGGRIYTDPTNSKAGGGCPITG